MNNQYTIERMKLMRLQGMAQLHYANLEENLYPDHTLDQYTSLLIEAEWENRQQRKIDNYLKQAGFKMKASVKDIDYTANRNLDRNLVDRILTLDFIKKQENMILTGPTGVGKSYLAQAIGVLACTQLKKTYYYNTNRLMEHLKLGKLDGNYLKMLSKIQKAPLLILDDFGLNSFDNTARQAMMDLFEDRYDKASTIVTSQIPISGWHEIIGEGTIADAILDRLVNSSHRINLQGESLRKRKLIP